MSQSAVQNPFAQFFSLAGLGLTGRAYIGEPNEDPETNPQAVYWDVEATDPAFQPIEILNGYIMRSGTPAVLYGADTFSIRVKTYPQNVTVFYSANVPTYASTSLENVVMTPDQAEDFRVKLGIVTPINDVLPVITGNTGLGDTLTCSTGTWSGSLATYTYQWRRGGVNQVGETANTYVLTSGDEGQMIDCVVTASNGYTAPGVATADPVGPINFFPGLENATLANMVGLTSTIQAVIAGASTKRMAWLGDSITSGVSCLQGSSAVTTARANAPVAQAAAELAANRACPVSLDAFYGTPLITAIDTHVVPAASGFFGSGNYLGGASSFATTGTLPQTFTPTYNFDTYGFSYFTYPGVSGYIDIYVDGVLTQHINTDAPAGAHTVEYTTTLGAHVIEIKRDSLIVNWQGLYTFDSTAKRLINFNFGASGATTESFAQVVDGRDTPGLMASMTMDCAVIMLGANDLRTGVSAATTAANLDTIITNTKAMCGGAAPLVVIPWYIDYAPGPAHPSLASQQATFDAMIAVCGPSEQNCPYLVMTTYWGATPALANASGELGGDLLHPTLAGAADLGVHIIDCIFGDGG